VVITVEEIPARSVEADLGISAGPEPAEDVQPERRFADFEVEIIPRAGRPYLNRSTHALTRDQAAA
jgi:DNA-binding transcriptional LysR family regulator